NWIPALCRGSFHVTRHMSSFSSSEENQDKDFNALKISKTLPNVYNRVFKKLKIFHVNKCLRTFCR
ncbi:hypothetical protein L9F63_026092, partial [Diploptera punctata]